MKKCKLDEVLKTFIHDVLQNFQIISKKSSQNCAVIGFRANLISANSQFQPIVNAKSFSTISGPNHLLQYGTSQGSL